MKHALLTAMDQDVKVGTCDLIMSVIYTNMSRGPWTCAASTVRLHVIEFIHQLVFHFISIDSSLDGNDKTTYSFHF